MKRARAVLYTAKLFAVQQTSKHRGEVWDQRLAADIETGIPYLYTKDQCDEGQLDYGFEKYVPVTVTVAATRQARKNKRKEK